MGIDDISGKADIALIAGPTASGKSALAVALADRIGGVIVNADSAQVYRDLRVLSARPTPAEETTVPHRLFGYLDAADPCSAARWADDAKSEIARAQSLGLVPILAGGTGLYLRTLIDGIAPIPEIDPAVRTAVRALPVAEAHTALAAQDPESAARLAPSDAIRIARALEVIRSTGKPIGRWREEKTGGIADRIILHPLILLPDRGRLQARCDRRFERMLDEGAVEEVEHLLARSLDPQLPAMRAIGVREIAGWLGGEYNRDQAIAAGQLATRQYAKRQYTWFRRQPPPEWPRIGESEYDEAVIRLAQRFR